MCWKNLKYCCWPDLYVLCVDLAIPRPRYWLTAVSNFLRASPGVSVPGTAATGLWAVFQTLVEPGGPGKGKGARESESKMTVISASTV